MEPPSKLRVVIDTNQILQDIWYSIGKNTQTALQDLLQKDEYWVFMAEPVFQEVEEKLIELRRGDVDKQGRPLYGALPTHRTSGLSA